LKVAWIKYFLVAALGAGLFYLWRSTYSIDEGLRPPPTLTDYVKSTDYVVIANGQKLHWVKADVPVEVSGPSHADGNHEGPTILTARIVSTLRCVKPCPQSGEVNITLEGSSGLDERGIPITDGRDLVGKDIIFLVTEANFDLTKVYPKQLIGPWNVRSLTARTAYPISAKSEIDKAIKTIGNNK